MAELRLILDDGVEPMQSRPMVFAPVMWECDNAYRNSIVAFLTATLTKFARSEIDTDLE